MANEQADFDMPLEAYLGHFGKEFGATIRKGRPHNGGKGLGRMRTRRR